MEVILLERVGKLGHMGDVVRVKDGYARNFLLPRNKALRATKDNKAKFETMKAELQAKNEARKGEAGKLAGAFEGKSLTVLRQASEVGQLYGSVSPRDIAEMLSADGTPVNRSQIVLHAPIKLIGQYKVPVELHPEVEVIVLVNVARNEEEAERLKRGENVTVRRQDDGDDEAEKAAAAAAAKALFEEGAEQPADGEEEAVEEKND
ncbi:MAG: 50S ribosomal protein L9 [Rhizobiales bacterium]|nr:50S ribosomal protein L9 [Hyphomicrobiales bacterium]OJY46072.1 MAG: 50S ribosomal protein L9 [Rhizobiales bacterium 64-17]